MAEEKELNELDELNDLELDDDLDLDNVDLTKFGEVNEVIEAPHVRFATKGFINVLKVLKQVCSTSGRDVVSKSFLVHAENGKVTFKATDFDTYFETELECQNTENVCGDNIVIPLDIILKLVNVLPQSTIIVKKENSYYIHLVGGDMILETYQVDTTKYTLGDTFEECGAIASASLTAILRDFGSLAKAALNPGDRRICFTKDNAVTAYNYAVIRKEDTFADFDLKIKDINVLAYALAGSDEIVKVYNSVGAKAKRVAVIGEKFKYYFLVSDVKANEKLVSTCTETTALPGIYVDFVQFSRLVRVAYELPYAVGKVNLNYDETDNLVIEIQTKKQASSIFRLAGSRSGDAKPLSKPLVVQAKLLYVLLNSFRNESSVDIILSDKCLGIKTDNYSGALLVDDK